MRVYVHGAGRSGREAWPHATVEGAIFADLVGASMLRSKVDLLADIVPGGATVIAHSWGAVPTVITIAERRIRVGKLVLLEPALYDIARGEPAIERHIAEMEEARSYANDGKLFEYWSIVRPMMFGGRANRDSWDSDRKTAEWFAEIEPPWGHGVTAEMVQGVPTLVITGGWNEEYEAIAGALTKAGATHRQLHGNKHRPQDHADFESVLAQFEVD